MQTPEARLRSRIVKALQSLHAIPVENPVHAGTPDVNYADGWIELKIDEFREDGSMPLRHFTSQQRAWLYHRWQHGGGRAHLLVHVPHEATYVLDGRTAFISRGMKREWFEEHSCKWWKGMPHDGELLDLFKGISARTRY